MAAKPSSASVPPPALGEPPKRVMPGQPQAMLDWGALHRRPLRRESGKYFHSERDLTCRKLKLTIVSLREVAVRTSLRC